MKSKDEQKPAESKERKRQKRTPDGVKGFDVYRPIGGKEAGKQDKSR